jgi:hypothetical protein
MSRLISDRTLKVYELIQELAQHNADAEVIIDFEFPTDIAICPLCGGEYETVNKVSGMVTKVDTADYDRWRAIHLICKED